MKTTELVAWVGATTGIASLVWNIYTKVTANRPKLVVKTYANMIQMPRPPKNPRFLRVTVQNIGTVPTTITNVELYTLVPRSKRLLYRLHLKKRGEEIHAIINDYRGPQMPHKLEVGGEWVALMEQDRRFEDWLNTGSLHCAVHHSFSERPVSSTIIRGPV
jgi:hypothetical protein